MAIDALEAQQAKEGNSVLVFHQVRDALIRGCVPREGTRTFLNVRGSESRGISLLANDFSKVERIVDLASGARPESVGEVANRR